jgi:flagellar basal-body rod protein FlgG
VSTSKIFTPGALAQTGGDLDLAISGDGFFEIEGTDGARLYTRDGRFFKDSNGDLVTGQGYKLIPGLTVPPEAVRIDVAKDGTVSYQSSDSSQVIGQITIVRFLNPAGLSSEGGNLFRATGNSGEATTVAPGTQQSGQIMQGYVERSNVDVASELIALIQAQRAFEVNSKAIRVSDEMLNVTNQLTR